MRWASVSLAVLVVLAACVGVYAQAPQRDGPPPDPRVNPRTAPRTAPRISPRQAPPDERQGDVDRPPRPRWRGDHDQPMTEQQVREALEVLRRIDPEKAEKLEQHVAENPERVGRALRDNFPNLGRFLAMRRYDPEAFDLRIEDLRFSREADRSARRLRQAEADGDDVLAAAERQVLEQIVADHFDVRQQIREHELMKLEQRIEQLRQQLQDRADDRNDLIQQRIKELVGEDPHDRW
jgi:hypothetical protein